jgi:uncharacterized RDD family membrane protein YckC
MIRYAGFWLRLSAALIDFLIMTLVFIPVLALAGVGWEFVYNDSVAASLGFVVNVVAAWLYYALFESGRWQATPGKKILELRVTDLFGNRISFGQASGRYFSKILSGLIFYIGFLMAGFTAKKQALHDKVASTLVLRGTDDAQPYNFDSNNNDIDQSSVNTVYVPQSNASRWVMSGFDLNGHVVRLTFSEDSPKLISGGLYIGRDASACDLHMNDPSVSRRHAKLTKEQGVIWIQDLESANGTSVNGLSVKPNQLIKLPTQGEVAFGAVELTTAMY